MSLNNESDEVQKELTKKLEGHINIFEKPPSYPLGLPKGSVRAILSILVVGTFCILAICSAFGMNAVDGPLSMLGPFAGFTLKDYMSSRDTAKENLPASKGKRAS